MNFLLPSKKAYSDYYKRSKFNLVWFTGTGISLLLLVVLFSNYYYKIYNITPNIISVIICLIGLVILYISKSYKIATYFVNIAFLILISIIYFTVTGTLHYVTPMWMMLNILFGYFIHGKKWGTFLFISHFLVFFFFIYFELNNNIQSIEHLSRSNSWNFIIEFSIVASAIFYMLKVYSDTNKHALKEEKLSKKKLLEQNEIISKQNKEKEVMLKEIHHRVKNNLQIITSILRLQSEEDDNPKSISTFKEAINRVESIAIIHEIIYKQDFVTNFDLEKYFLLLVNNVIANYNFRKKVDLEVKSELTCVQCNSIVPMAILLNELVTNSFKHAFDKQKAPKISIFINNIDQRFYKLSYKDNGQWKENKNNSSFGTEMINTVTEQLDGEYKIFKTETGTEYVFTLQNIEG